MEKQYKHNSRLSLLIKIRRFLSLTFLIVLALFLVVLALLWTSNIFLKILLFLCVAFILFVFALESSSPFVYKDDPKNFCCYRAWQIFINDKGVKWKKLKEESEKIFDFQWKDIESVKTEEGEYSSNFVTCVKLRNPYPNIELKFDMDYPGCSPEWSPDTHYYVDKVTGEIVEDPVIIAVVEDKEKKRRIEIPSYFSDYPEILSHFVRNTKQWVCCSVTKALAQKSKKRILRNEIILNLTFGLVRDNINHYR